MTIKENCKAVWDKLTCEACPFLCHEREVRVCLMRNKSGSARNLNG